MKQIVSSMRVLNVIYILFYFFSKIFSSTFTGCDSLECFVKQEFTSEELYEVVCSTLTTY